MVVLRYNIGIRGLKTQNYIAWIGITVVIYAKSHFEVDIFTSGTDTLPASWSLFRHVLRMRPDAPAQQEIEKYFAVDSEITTLGVTADISATGVVRRHTTRSSYGTFLRRCRSSAHTRPGIMARVGTIYRTIRSNMIFV